MKKTLLLFCAALLSWNVHALEIAGVQLADKAQVGSASLQLNGAAIRTKYFFRIYVAALYLPQKQTSGEAIIADEHEHRMAMHMLYGLSSERMFNGFYEAFEACHSADEMAALDTQLREMRQIFDAVKEVLPGDIITLDYLPAAGTQISVNGTARGTIAGAAFYRALLKIWIGSKPVQEDLKKGLLGG